MKKNIIGLIVLEFLAVLIGVISAIGSTCPAFNPPTEGPLAIIGQLQILFILTTLMTYLAAILAGIVIWAIFAHKPWCYQLALITAILGAVSGIIPSYIVMNNGMSFSPSLMRAVLNTIILLFLLFPGMRSNLLIITNDKSAGKVLDQKDKAAVVSTLLLVSGVVLLFQPLLVESSHIINNVNYYDFQLEQMVLGIVGILTGILNWFINRYQLAITQSNSSPTDVIEGISK